MCWVARGLRACGCAAGWLQGWLQGLCLAWLPGWLQGWAGPQACVSLCGAAAAAGATPRRACWGPAAVHDEPWEARIAAQRWRLAHATEVQVVQVRPSPASWSQWRPACRALGVILLWQVPDVMVERMQG